jgi:hypothetical protein
MTTEETFRLDLTRDQLAVVWDLVNFMKKCGTSYVRADPTAQTALDGLVLARAVEAGIACPKHPRERLVHDHKAEANPGWVDPVYHRHWPILSGQANLCPLCRAVIHVPGGRGAPVAPYCLVCNRDRTPEEQKELDAAVRQRDQELSEILKARQDREAQQARCGAGDHVWQNLGPARKCVSCGTTPAKANRKLAAQRRKRHTS